MRFLKLTITLFLLLFAAQCFSSEWYVGGNLHQSSGLDWQQATYENKLATAGDLVAAVYQSKRLSNELSAAIKGMEDIKVIAEELVVQLDAAFEPEPDPRQNEVLFSNQKVSSTAAMIMMMSGWLNL